MNKYILDDLNVQNVSYAVNTREQYYNNHAHTLREIKAVAEIETKHLKKFNELSSWNDFRMHYIDHETHKDTLTSYGFTMKNLNSHLIH